MSELRALYKSDWGRFIIRGPVFLTLCIHSSFADDGDASSQ